MSDPLYDDVRELLDKELGDERILKQILRACENNEIISNYERNYVQKLSERHLGRKPLGVKPSVKPFVSDVAIPESRLQKSQTYQINTVSKAKPSPKNTKVILGIGGALVIVLAIAFVVSGNTNLTKPDVVQPITTTPSSLSIDADSNSYQKKDIISISGFSPSTGDVTLSIENSGGALVWSEKIKTKSDGRFTTLVIAGGDGWEKSGTFTIKVTNNQETKSKIFTFTA